MSPGKISPTHSYMPRSVHMREQNFRCVASIMHEHFKFHIHDKIVSHKWKDFTWDKMHGKKFTRMTKIFHMYYKISHACQKVHMHVKCWCGELVFLPTLISHGSFFHTLFTPFSHDFHTHSPSSELAAARSSLIITSLLKPPVLRMWSWIVRWPMKVCSFMLSIITWRITEKPLSTLACQSQSQEFPHQLARLRKWTHTAHMVLQKNIQSVFTLNYSKAASTALSTNSDYSKVKE